MPRSHRHARDAALRDRINAHLAALGTQGVGPDELRLEYAALASDLRSAVGGFPALPSQEPERSHDALCVFVHVMASQTMKMSTSWPDAVARELEISDRA